MQRSTRGGPGAHLTYFGLYSRPDANAVLVDREIGTWRLVAAFTPPPGTAVASV